MFRRRNYAELQYRVLINDNVHYMDESERAAHGVFGSAPFTQQAAARKPILV
jgi:hypothetical protein